MSEPRFEITIKDRKKNRTTKFSVDGMIAVWRQEQEHATQFMVSLRGVTNEHIAEGMANLLDRLFEIVGPDVLDRVPSFLGRVPSQAAIIDYSGDEVKMTPLDDAGGDQ